MGKALCFGWIDSRREALDGTYFLQRYTPRRSRSRWSRMNRETAERLIAEGKMRPAGLAEIERARPTVAGKRPRRTRRRVRRPTTSSAARATPRAGVLAE